MARMAGIRSESASVGEMKHSGKRSAAPPKELHHIELAKAENGGAVATHHFTHFDHAPEPHVFAKGDGKELAAHIGKHMGMSMGANPAESEPENEE